MAITTNIPWTRSTFNPWIGCQEISVSAPDGDTTKGGACDNCYARELDSRKRWGGTTHWGAMPRYRTAKSTWDNVKAWNKAAGIEKELGTVIRGDWHTPGFWPVFCASLADVFDNDVPEEWRADLWALIEATPNLTWYLVTKRVGNVSRMVPLKWVHTGEGGGFPPHVRLLISIGNQFEADRDIEKLLALPCKNGISFEPALGPVDWSRWLQHGPILPDIDPGREFGIEWIICGGESGTKARPFDIAWARSTIAQCRAAGVPVFCKQLGAWQRAIAGPDGIPRGRRVLGNDGHMMVIMKDRAGADPAEWPEDLRVREFPK